MRLLPPFNPSLYYLLPLSPPHPSYYLPPSLPLPLLQSQYARVEVFRTDHKGWGLQAMEDIPACVLLRGW